MPRPSYISTDVLNRSRSLAFEDKANRDIWSLGFGQQSDDDIDSLASLIEVPDPAPPLTQFGQTDTASPFSPSPSLAPANPLPIVQTAYPDIRPPAPRTPIPETPSGTPAGMPTAPRTVNATITAGPRPDQQLRPGETVGSVTLAAAPPGRGQIEAYIRQAATARGIDPDIAVAVARSEGGLDDPVRQSDVVKNGVRERSYGPFQLYMDGGLGNAAAARGIDPQNPAHWQAAIDFSLDEAAKGGWGPWYGAARVGIGTRQGLETAKPIGVQASTNATPPSAAPRGGGVQPPEQANAEAVAQSTTAFTRNQGEAGTALGLPWSTTLEICGPVAAAAFLRKNGRLPGREEAEAMRVAQEKGYWKPGRGMGGPDTTSALLTDLGVANKKENGVDWEKVKADVSRGNPVIIDTSGHLFVVEGYDPKTGKFNFGESAKFLKASGGNPWYRPEEVAGLGMGAPRASIYLDNPETAAPSAVAGRAENPPPVPLAPSAPDASASRDPNDTVQVISPEGTTMTVPRFMFGEGPGKYSPSTGWRLADPRQSLNTGAGAAPAAPAAAPGGAPPATGGSPDPTVLWSPDGPVAQQGAYQAATGRSGGSGVMQRGPLSAMPQEVGNDGPIAPGPVPNLYPEPPPPPPAIPYGPPLSEAGPEMPTSYNDPTAGGTISTPIPPPPAPSYTIVDGRTAPPTAQGTWTPVQTIPNPQRPPAADPGQWLAEDSQSTPVEVAGYPLTPPGSPYGDQQAAMEPAPNRFEDRSGYGQVVASPGEPDYVDSRPQTVTQAIGQGIQSARGPGGMLEPAAGIARITGRMTEIGRIAAAETGKPLGPVAVADPAWRARNPDLVAEYDDLQRQFDVNMLGNMDAPRRVAQGAAQIAAPIVREAAEGVASRARGLVDDAVERIVMRPQGWEAASDDVFAITKPGHYYRGMTETEYNATLGSGRGAQSRQDFSVANEGTSFSNKAEDAESYANYGRDDPRKTGRPTYLVEVAGDDGLRLDRDGYWKAEGEIPADRITRIIRMVPEDGAVVGEVLPPPTVAGRALNAGADAPLPSTLGSGYVPDPESRRFYHGTAGEFATPDPGKFDQNGLYGPGYYLTDDPRVANSYAEAGGERFANTREGRQLARLHKDREELVPYIDSYRNGPLRERLGAEQADRGLAEVQSEMAQIDQEIDRLTALSPSSGPNVRAIDVPNDLRMLDADAPVSAEDAAVLAETYAARWNAQGNRRRVDPVRLARQWVREKKTGSAIWSQFRADGRELGFVRDGEYATDVVTGRVNAALSEAGYDGIAHQGGRLMPILDGDGKPVEHGVNVIFPNALPRIRNAFSGEVGGSGLVPGMSDARNAAQGGLVGAMSEATSDEELTPQERLARIAAGGALGVAAGRGMRSRGGRQLGSGFVADSGPTPRSRMNMEDVAQRAQEVLGVKPEQVRAWQSETLAEPAYGRAVRGSALQQAANIDEDAAMRAIERLERAQAAARAVDDVADLSVTERMELADATLEAAETALAFQGSKAASTAEGRATARALAQRRQQITAKQGFENAKRAQQVGKDAEQAASVVRRAQATGRLTPKDEGILRALETKLREAEKNGLVGDGAGGRLAAMEQRAATATADGKPKPPAWGYLVTEAAERRANPGAMRSEASRYSPGWGTAIAGELGSQLGGGAVGATVGAAMDEENPQRGAALGFAAGAGAGFGARRISMRGNRTLGLLGPMPTPDMPNRSIALGPDSKQYTFAYRVVDLDDLVTSNTPTGTVNPAYPAELQPRDRTRAASQVQVDRIVQEFNPTELLHDGGRLDSGPMIVGPDRAVESGNGRTMALRRLAQERPEEYARYVETLRGNLSEFGLDESALAGKRAPVLVRERLSDVDRPAFAATANGRVSAGMSPVEQARQAATSLSDEVVGNLTIGDGDTIATALRRPENRDIVRAWVAAMPENDVANILDQNGNISGPGYQQLADTLLVRTYGEGAGVRAFIEAADPDVRNVQTAVMASLPDVARAEALIRSGQRAADLSLAGDVAAATEVLGRLRRDRMSVGDYIRQVAMGDRELTPFQEQVLQFLDQNQKRPGAIREALREYAAAVENTADPNQMDMFGGAVASVTKEDAWKSATAGVRREREARVASQRAKLQAENAARTPAADIVPRTGGPEGRLEVEGAPQPTPRPGPTGGTGDPTRDARLRAEGGQVPLEATPRPGPTGGAGEAVTDARLANNGQLPLEPTARPGAVGDMSTGGPEGTLTLASGRTVKEVADQIKDVLDNPNAPDAAQRLAQLHQALREVSTAGVTRSSEIRRRLQKQGLLRAGIASKTDDVDGLVKALANADPSKPEQMQAILKIISKPRLIDKILEYQYVNMLSSPITQGVNIISNIGQIAGRLVLQNPLEYVFTGGQSSGVRAAIEGTGRGFSEALPEVKQIMRTGVSNKSMERAAELGDYANVRRELLTEQFGRTGALMHVISTRPLQAMDALLGHMAYAGAAEQYAQRTADRLLKQGDAAVKGMSREQAKAHIMANIWDYPEIIEKSGKISDYTLLKSNDSKGSGWGNRAERDLRRIVALGRAEDQDGFVGQSMAFMVNQVLPFFNVPLNAAKQGVERSAGAIYNPIRAVGAARATRAAEKVGDAAGAYASREQFGELATKGAIAASALTTGAVLAWGDNLTGDGPSDPGKRAVWEQTHKRNSWRVPGTSQWISWEGSPMAVPFGMIAGAKEGWKESKDAAAKKGESDTGDAIAAAGIKTLQGGFSGFASQSFVRALGQQYQLMTGDQTGLGTVAASLTGTASRFMPSSSMVNWLARVTDTMERDASKPQKASDLPENVGARLATRVPGLRQQVAPRLDIYGEPAPNEQAGLPGVLPYYRGAGARAGDPITQALEASGVGAPSATAEVTHPRVEGLKVPLKTPQEQRIFQQAYGREFRRLLEESDAGQGDLTPDQLEKLRGWARQEAVITVLEAIGPDEIERRTALVPAGVR